MNPQYKIYDAHTHIFPDMIAGKATDSIGDFYKYPMHAPAMVKALLEEGETIGTERLSCLFLRRDTAAGGAYQQIYHFRL